MKETETGDSGANRRRRKRIAGVEQGNGWLITELLTYHGLYVLHNRRQCRCHDRHRGKPHRYPVASSERKQKFILKFVPPPRDNASVSSSFCPAISKEECNGTRAPFIPRPCFARRGQLREIRRAI